MSEDSYRWNGNRSKKKRKAFELSRGKRSDFERIEGEGTLRMRN